MPWNNFDDMFACSLSEDSGQYEELTKRLPKGARERDCEDGWTAVNPLDLRGTDFTGNS